MNLNYHIANGASNPWQLPTEVFDEGVDINTVLALIDATILVVMVRAGVAARQARPRRRLSADGGGPSGGPRRPAFGARPARLSPGGRTRPQ